VVEPVLVGVGICTASVLVAVLLGLLLSRGLERLFGGRRHRSAEFDDPESAEPEFDDAEPPDAERPDAEPQDAEAPNL
jgi:hypothetical protein